MNRHTVPGDGRARMRGSRRPVAASAASTVTGHRHPVPPVADGRVLIEVSGASIGSFDILVRTSRCEGTQLTDRRRDRVATVIS